MNKPNDIEIAAKSAPDGKIFKDAKRAGINAVELYLSEAIIGDIKSIASLCGDFSFRYAMHAPNDCYDPKKISWLARVINAEIVIFHNIFWEDEWPVIMKAFKGVRAKPCIENTLEALKFMRRYKMGSCLDLEHLQMECGGVYEEEFLKVINKASHIHLTGYVWGSQLWHSHIHYSAQHNLYMLGMIKKAGYRGLITSESMMAQQTYDEFKRLHDFFEKWKVLGTKK